jgi:hypothetical protein
LGKSVLVLGLYVTLGIAGCAPSIVKGPPLEKALRDMNQGFVKYGYVNTQDLLNPTVTAEAVEAIRRKQCSGNDGEPRADPLLFSPSSGTLALQGTFSDNGGFQVVGAPMPVPSVNFGVANQGGNTVTFNYQLMTLSNLPAYNFQSRVVNAQADLKVVAALASSGKASDSTNATKGKDGTGGTNRPTPNLNPQQVALASTAAGRITADLKEIDDAAKDEQAVAADISFLEGNFQQYYRSHCCEKGHWPQTECGKFDLLPSPVTSTGGGGGPVLR